MARDLDQALAWCLDALERGESSLEQCLTRFPEHRSELELLLPLATNLRDAPSATPSLRFRQRARGRLLSKLPPRVDPDVGSQRPARAHAQPKGEYRPLVRRSTMPWIVVTILVLSLVGGGGAVAYAADGSTPGDALYPLDTAIEDLRMAITTDPAARAELGLQIAQERLHEANQLVDEEAPGELISVALDGYGKAISEAALALAAAGDGSTRAEALQALLQQTQELRQVVLRRVREHLPEAAQEAVDRAQEASEQAEQQLERFSDGLPVDGTGEGPPDDLPVLPPEREGAEDSDASREWAEAARARVEEVRALISEGSCQQIPQTLEAFQAELEAEGRELAELAQQDPERAEELAQQFRETAEELTAELLALMETIPEECASAALQAAKEALEQGMDQFFETFPFESPEDFFGGHYPGGNPFGADEDE